MRPYVQNAVTNMVHVFEQYMLSRRLFYSHVNIAIAQ